MNTRKTKEIEKLVERFFDGETTLEEEARLYRLFRSKRLPESLEQDISVENTYDTPLMEAFSSMRIEEPYRTASVRPLWRLLAGAVAVLALVAGLSFYSDYCEDRSLARIYGGSYVIQNGRRIDDLSAIRDDIEKTLADSRYIEERAEFSVVDHAEQDVLNNISDPDIRHEVEQMLNE